mmetsp:Transcript_7218/g.30727  ORF Transcript_7218/g.30727 Transcript_7218/m.30727 type:complete len:307 (+) Transcript_7218:564-1484(+)
MDRIESALREDTGENERHAGGTAKAEERVDDGAESLDSFSSNDGVEGRPQQPQEERSAEAEQITGVARGVVGVAPRVVRGEEESHCHAEVGAESVNVEAATNVKGLELEGADEDVEPVEECLEDAEEEQLDGRDLAENSAVRDHDSTGGKETVEDVEESEGHALREALPVSVEGDEEGLEQNGPLHDHGADEERVADRAVAVPAEEGHEEAESEEDHDANVAEEVVEVLELVQRLLVLGIAEPHCVDHHEEDLEDEQRSAEDNCLYHPKLGRFLRLLLRTRGRVDQAISCSLRARQGRVRCRHCNS